MFSELPLFNEMKGVRNEGLIETEPDREEHQKNILWNVIKSARELPKIDSMLTSMYRSDSDLNMLSRALIVLAFSAFLKSFSVALFVRKGC